MLQKRHKLEVYATKDAQELTVSYATEDCLC